jgi:hypothetical protein
MLPLGSSKSMQVNRMYLDDSGDRPLIANSDIKREGIGILYFVYGLNNETVSRFFKQAEIGAQTFKRTNPDLKIGIWLSEGPRITFPFDFIGYVNPKDIVSKRQWLTRITYMARSPFEITLAVDSQALACSPSIYPLLQGFATPGNTTNVFDIAFNSKYNLNLKNKHVFEPHNWMLLYRWNDRIRDMFELWEKFHGMIERRKNGMDDQSTLHKVINKRRLKGLRVGRFQNNFAVACVERERATDKKRRATQMLQPGQCHIFHLAIESEEEERTICDLCSRYSDRSRVLVQLSRLEYVTVFNQDELDRATQNRGAPTDWSEIHDDFVYDWFESVKLHAVSGDTGKGWYKELVSAK